MGERGECEEWRVREREGMWEVEGEGDGEGNVRCDEERKEGECEEWRVS